MGFCIRGIAYDRCPENTPDQQHQVMAELIHFDRKEIRMYVVEELNIVVRERKDGLKRSSVTMEPFLRTEPFNKFLFTLSHVESSVTFDLFKVGGQLNDRNV